MYFAFCSGFSISQYISSINGKSVDQIFILLSNLLFLNREKSIAFDLKKNMGKSSWLHFRSDLTTLTCLMRPEGHFLRGIVLAYNPLVFLGPSSLLFCNVIEIFSFKTFRKSYFISLCVWAMVGSVYISKPLSVPDTWFGKLIREWTASEYPEELYCIPFIRQREIFPPSFSFLT